LNAKLRTSSYALDIHAILHDDPGTIIRYYATINDFPVESVDVVQSCPRPQTCRFDRRLNLDLGAFPYSGWQVLRINAQAVEPNGQYMLTQAAVPVYMATSKPQQDYYKVAFNYTYDYASGKGWYAARGKPQAEHGYVSGFIYDPPPVGVTVRGQWSVGVGSGVTDVKKPITRLLVKLDATHTSPGIVVYDVPNEDTYHALTIDTTQLEDGWHSLLVRAEIFGVDSGTGSEDQLFAGTTRTWFYVDNSSSATALLEFNNGPADGPRVR
jgi:hypothetical protein